MRDIVGKFSSSSCLVLAKTVSETKIKANHAWKFWCFDADRIITDPQQISFPGEGDGGDLNEGVQMADFGLT